MGWPLWACEWDALSHFAFHPELAFSGLKNLVSQRSAIRVCLRDFGVKAPLPLVLPVHVFCLPSSLSLSLSLSLYLFLSLPGIPKDEVIWPITWGILLHTKRVPNRFQNNFGSVAPPPTLPNIIPKTFRQGRPRDSEMNCSQLIRRLKISRNNSVRQSQNEPKMIPK